MQSKAKTNAKPHAKKEKESLGQVLYRVFIGIIFGFANVIPGVSGGTAMVVFGVYERIILFITDIRHRLKQDWKFFLPIGIGMAISILFFGSVMDVLLQKHEALMQTFFIGVIVFSVPMIFKEAFGGKRDRSKDLLCAIIFLVVLALMVVMAVLKTDTDQQKEVIKAGVEQGEIAQASSGWLLEAIKMIGCGALACATMIIPGISGSLVMVIIGVYGEIMAALHALNLAVLVPFAIGCLLGLFFCAELIRFLLKRYPRQTYSAILGFVVGSVFPIFPGWAYIAPVAAFGVGAAAIVACDKFAPPAK
ncbi:MAG: DUF368 domain-containing protein [Clostridia bacterium]|nr:DUF368 domain-containing protein [Clostridia bacterium]